MLTVAAMSFTRPCGARRRVPSSRPLTRLLTGALLLVFAAGCASTISDDSRELDGAPMNGGAVGAPSGAGVAAINATGGGAAGQAVDCSSGAAARVGLTKLRRLTRAEF